MRSGGKSRVSSFLLLLGGIILLVGCTAGVRPPLEPSIDTPLHVPGTIPAPEATFGSMTSGSTAMQSERFKTYGSLGAFSGQVIESSYSRSTEVKLRP